MSDAETIIRKLGGQAKVAELCEVTPQAVNQWRKKIPHARLMYLRAIRPDVFGTPAGEAASPQKGSAVG